MGKSNINFNKAKFFCENCGEEVPQNAKVCTKCGKFFSFVRCPNCFFTGESKIFTKGCPKCGYAVKPYGGAIPSSSATGNGSQNTKSKKGKKSLPSLFGRFGKNNKNTADTKNYDSSLPVWIYVVTIVVLVAVIFGIYSCL